MTTDQILLLFERCGKLTPEQLKPIRLNEGEYIRKPLLFVNSHIERISNGGKPAKPYADRLEKFLEMVNA